MDADAAQGQHWVPHGLEHEPDLALAALMDNAVGRARFPQLVDDCGGGHLAFDEDAALQRLLLRGRQRAINQRVVYLLDVVGG